ncbi:mycothiol transferase [Arthrobacter sp. H14]|uniref:mycothiol transferase n=1 Tax=Arthrobacter sp. H14 TaxID=1312959 RepID=UPI0009DF9A7C
MTTLGSHDPIGFVAPLHEQFQTFLDDHRRALHDSLHDVTEEESRARLVPSKTTLLGLVKHATFVELVWFNEAITGKTRAATRISCGNRLLQAAAQRGRRSFSENGTFVGVIPLLKRLRKAQPWPSVRG